jgi:hypothetical protein
LVHHPQLAGVQRLVQIAFQCQAGLGGRVHVDAVDLDSAGPTGGCRRPARGRSRRWG